MSELGSRCWPIEYLLDFEAGIEILEMLLAAFSIKVFDCIELHEADLLQLSFVRRVFDGAVGFAHLVIQFIFTHLYQLLPDTLVVTQWDQLLENLQVDR